MKSFPVTWHDSLPSTQDEAMRRLAGGETDFVVAARAQSAGRGRRGSGWHAPPGLALLATFAFRQSATRPAGELTLVMAISLLDCITPLLPPEARAELTVKWPNDLWINRAKVAGILGEARTQGETVLVALGVGVNVLQREQDFEQIPDRDATSLALAGCVKPLTPESFLRALLPCFHARKLDWVRSGLAPALAELQSRWAFTHGDDLQVEWQDGLHQARYVGVSASGAIVVQLKQNSEVVELIAGEIKHVKRV